MLLKDERYPHRPHGLLARLADRIGTRIAGDTLPPLHRHVVANALIRRAGGVLVYDEKTKRRTAIPKALLDVGIIPRGVSTLRATPTLDARTQYSFVSRDVSVSPRGIRIDNRHTTRLTV